MPRSTAYERFTTGRARLWRNAARQSHGATSDAFSRTVARSSKTNGVSNAFW
jgi:hypothetical protein